MTASQMSIRVKPETKAMLQRKAKEWGLSLSMTGYILLKQALAYENELKNWTHDPEN